MSSLKRLHLSIYIHIYLPKQFRRQTARSLFVITETESLVYELNKTCLKNLHEKIQFWTKKTPGT